MREEGEKTLPDIGFIITSWKTKSYHHKNDCFSIDVVRK
jgi:hypothetical protein